MNSDGLSQRYLLAGRTILIVGLVLVLLLAACGTAQEDSEQIEGVPGAYSFSEGKTAYPHLYQRAIDHLEAIDYRAAEAIYRELIEHEPGNANGYIGLGTALSLQDRFEEARTIYAEALKLAPDSVEALIGLGSVASRLEEFAEASGQYAKALALDPENLQAHWGRAVVLKAMGQQEEALAHLERVVELAPDSSLALEAQNLMREIRPGGE